MIETATRWFEIVHYNDIQSDTIANLVDEEWLCIYKRPAIFTYHGNEFLGHAFKNNFIQEEYVINTKFAITSNPQKTYLKNSTTHIKPYTHL